MKLISAVSIAAVLLFGVFGMLSVALISTTDLLDLQARELARAGESIRVAQSLKNRLLVHNRDVFLYEFNNDLARFDSRQSQRDEIESLLAESELFTNNSDEKRVFDKVREEIRAYLDRRELDDGQSGSSVSKFDLASIDADNAIAVVDELVALNRAQMDQLVSSIGAQNAQANVVAGLLFVFGAVILLGIAYAVFRLIARPLTVLAHRITEFSSGGAAARVVPAGFTEIQMVSSNFNSMTERLEEKRKDQLRFIASIAHDLRNPLNSMSIATDVLLRLEPTENKRLLEVIFRQVKNLDRLVSDLLDTTHIESGHLHLNLTQHDIHAIVQDAVDLHRTASGLHYFRVESAETPISCDGARISQVINNLLSNAVKYSPTGGAITIKTWNEGGLLHVSVSDQGIGIDSEDLEEIFKPFQRSKATTGTIPGIGLGLSTSRRIVEAHGGTLTVCSEPGNGATFEIRLPRKAV